MSRVDKRQQIRTKAKLNKKLQNLTASQQELVEIKSKELSDAYIARFLDGLDRNVVAAMLLNGADIKAAEDMKTLVGNLLIEDIFKIQEFEKQFNNDEEWELTMKKIEAEIKEETKKLINEGLNNKEVIEKLMFKFPKLSKSMVTCAYQTVKEEMKREDPEVNKAAEQILNIIEGEDFMNNKEVEKAVEECKETVNPVVVTKATVQQANLNPQHESKLQVLAMTLKGENGVYRVCSEGVELTRDMSMMFFENANQLDKFTEEYKKVFEMMKA